MGETVLLMGLDGVGLSVEKSELENAITKYGSLAEAKLKLFDQYTPKNALC